MEIHSVILELQLSDRQKSFPPSCAPVLCVLCKNAFKQISVFSLVSFTGPHTYVSYRSIKNRDSSVGIALGYWLDDRGCRVRFPAGARNFSLHHRVQNGPEAHPDSYPMGNRGSFPGGKAAGAWSWPLTSIYCRGQECVELYIDSPDTPSWRGA
jgi:hypothetical protein